MRFKKEQLKNVFITSFVEKYALTVSPLFQLYGWKYTEVPGVRELTETLTDLVISTLTDNHDCVSHKTGRFCVQKSFIDGETELNIFLDLGTIYEYDLEKFKVKEVLK